jgi:NitT/TauT family transport system substrate-binding protein
MRKMLIGTILALALAGSAQAAELTKVHIGHAGVGLFRLPLYVAIENGFFADEGLDLEVIDTQSGSDADKMLAGGAVEFVTAPLVDTINLNKQGIHAIGVANLFDRVYNSVVVQKKLAGEVKQFSDLKGRTVGMTGVGSGTWQFALLMAAVNHMTRDDLNLVAVGTGAAVMGAVHAGRIDAMVYADPEITELIQTGEVTMLVDSMDEATHRKYIGNSALHSEIFTTETYIKQKPQIVQAFVNAIQRAIVWENSHTPQEVSTLISKYPGYAVSNYDPAIMLTSVTRSRAGWPPSAVIPREAVDNSMKIVQTIGVIDAPMPFDQLIDNSFAEKAVAQYPAK